MMTTIHEVFKFHDTGPLISDDYIDEAGKLQFTITFIGNSTYCCVEPECFLGIVGNSDKWIKLDEIYGSRVKTIEVTGKIENGVIIKESRGMNRQRLDAMEFSVQITRAV